jgi:hemerythrin-like domain-containing protein
MFPVDVLVSEHVLIIRVVNLIRKETEQIVKTQTIQPNTITQFIGFLRVFADKYHHGKEEGLLFRELSQRKLNETDKKLMFELMMEHALARRTVSGLEKAKDSYVEGKTEVLPDILQLLNTLIDLYPKHIEKEDKQFFYQSMEYFTQEEQDDMLKRSALFDQNFTNKYYAQVVDLLEK